jgi:hypothetical protein
MSSLCCRFKGPHMCTEKVQDVIMAWKGFNGFSTDKWSYEIHGEDKLERMNPYRFFQSVDGPVRFGRPDLYGRRLTPAGLIVNRCQKPVEASR